MSGGSDEGRDGGEGAAGCAAVSRTSLYSHLITRQTGRAVRLSIVRRLGEGSGPVVNVLDFRHVTIIDFSCADEVVAKLARTALGEDDAPERDLFFLFTGLEDHHLDPVESALRRRSLAVAAESRGGRPFLVGPVEEEARRVWNAVSRDGRTRPESLAQELGCGREAALELLAELHRRRLLLRHAGRYLSLQQAVSEASRPDAAGSDA